MNNRYLAIAFPLLMASCEKEPYDPDRMVSETAEQFAEAYFNFDFEEALDHVDPASAKWISFAASNVTQSDIDLYNQLNADTEADVCAVDWMNDSTATVTVIVKNVVEKQRFGQPSHVVDEAEYQLTVIERSNKAFVRMEGLPRSEKRNHD